MQRLSSGTGRKGLSAPCFGIPSRHVTLTLLMTAAILPAAADAQDLRGTPDGSAMVLLDPVSVTANRVPTPSRAVGSALSVISGQELEDRQIRLVTDALREVPGLAVNRTGPVGGLTQLRVRGSEGNQVLVMIDGIEVNDPSGGNEFDFAHLLAFDVERIEVLRGPQSALYGSDAIGGVVNIVTRDGEGAPVFSGAVEGGSFKTLGANAAVSGGGERYRFLASGSGFRTEGVSTAAEWRGNNEKDGYRNGTGFAKFGFSPTGYLDLDLIGRYTGFSAETDDFVGGAGAVDSDGETEGEQFFGRAQAKLKLLDGRWEHIVGAGYTDHQRDYLSGGTVTSTYEGDKTKLDYQTNVFLETPEVLDADHILTLALEREEESVVSTSAFSDLDRSITNTGYVGQYQLGLLDRLFLTGSVRFDRNDLFDDATTYRLTGAYTFDGTGTKIRASYGTGVKNPTMFELYGYSQNYQSNPNLKPERAKGWDVGIEQPFWNDKAVLDVTYFDQRITDLIQGSGTTSVNLPSQSTIDGAEIGLTVSPVGGLLLRAAYTFTDGEDSSGAELVRRPKHMASFNVNYTFLDDKAQANLGIVYNGKQKDWAWDSFFNRYEVDLAAYTLVNLAASYQVTETARIYGRIDNLFDKQYEEVWSYGSAGRAAYAGLRVSF
jgi:vitamin B12 transporter